MTELIKKLLIQALKDYADKTFTFDNLKLVRDRFLTLLKEQVEGTETQIDDWAYSIVEKMFDDTNLKKIFDWVVKYAGVMFGNVCTAPENSYEALAKEMEFTEAPEVCAMPDLKTVLAILEIVVPILYDWFKK